MSCHLAAGLDALDQAAADNDPGQQEAESNVPLHLADVPHLE